MFLETGMYFFLAMILLTLPLPWILSALLAAVVHELFHVAAVWLLRGRIRRVSVGIGGARMETELEGAFARILAALAGPLGSFLLLLLCRYMPKVAVCGCVQGLFNLLPIWPLDGGRAWRIFLEGVFPGAGERLFFLTEKAVVMMILALLCLGAAAGFLDFWVIPAAVMTVFGRLGRKIPCKQQRIGVQ